MKTFLVCLYILTFTPQHPQNPCDGIGGFEHRIDTVCMELDSCSAYHTYNQAKAAQYDLNTVSWQVIINATITPEP
jgi:hypothetical protein